MRLLNFDENSPQSSSLKSDPSSVKEEFLIENTLYVSSYVFVLTMNACYNWDDVCIWVDSFLSDTMLLEYLSSMFEFF